MGIRVCKFGGTSLADANQIRKVQAIIESEPRRRYVVPSAPGKRTPQDQKITDLLYLCHANASQQVPIDDVFHVIANRYRQIVSDLGLSLDMDEHLDRASRGIVQQAQQPNARADFAASRGEYLNGLILAKLLGFTFIDPVEVIRFDEKGRFDARSTQTLMSQRLAPVERAVVPGFFGAMPSGEVRTFSRGGSDVTGAIVAQGVQAEVYENWTDTDGVLMADPRVVDNPLPVEVITYRELRELAYMGATVLHDEAIFPVRKAGIPVNIRNTNRPQAPGTMIVAEAKPNTHAGTITGIAGRKDFTVVAVEKALMNQELGFGRRLLSAFEVNGVSYEHTPSGIDTMSVVVAACQLGNGKLDAVLEEIRRQCDPDSIEVHPNMALIATVGRGMASTPGIAANLFSALAEANVNVRMIDQGSSELNIIVGVEADDFEKAVRAIYARFVL